MQKLPHLLLPPLRHYLTPPEPTFEHVSSISPPHPPLFPPSAGDQLAPSWWRKPSLAPETIYESETPLHQYPLVLGRSIGKGGGGGGGGK